MDDLNPLTITNANVSSVEDISNWNISKQQKITELSPFTIYRGHLEDFDDITWEGVGLWEL